MSESSTFTIHEALPADIDVVHELWIALAEEMDKLDPVHRLAPSYREQGRDLMNDAIADDFTHVHVAFDGDRAIGFAIIRLQFPHGLFEQKPLVHISDVYVMPEYRRRGVATALVTHGIAFARKKGIGLVTLGVLANCPAIGLYEKLGFKVHRLSMTWQAEE